MLIKGCIQICVNSENVEDDGDYTDDDNTVELQSTISGFHMGGRGALRYLPPPPPPRF